MRRLRSRNKAQMIKKIARFFPIIGIVLFIYVLSKVDLNLVKETFLNMNLIPFLAAFALTIPLLFIKTSKWRQLVTPFKVKLGWKEGFSAWLVGFFLGLITPGRVGDLTRAFYLKKKMKIGTALTTVVIDRILDILVLMVLAGAGLIFILSNFAVSSSAPKIIAAFFLLFIAAVAFFIKKERARKLLRPIYNFFVPEKYKKTLKASFGDFYEGINVLQKNKLAVAKAAILSFVAWGIVSVQYYLLAMAMGVNINYFTLFMIMPTVILVEILPISFSGLGTRDATLILFFSFVGLSASAAVALSLTILMFSYIYSLAGLFIWMRNPIKL